MMQPSFLTLVIPFIIISNTSATHSIIIGLIRLDVTSRTCLVFFVKSPPLIALFPGIFAAAYLAVPTANTANVPVADAQMLAALAPEGGYRIIPPAFPLFRSHFFLLRGRRGRGWRSECGGRRRLLRLIFVMPKRPFLPGSATEVATVAPRRHHHRIGIHRRRRHRRRGRVVRLPMSVRREVLSRRRRVG